MSQKIILNAEDKITCPHCDQAFPLREGLSHHLIEQYENEYEAMLSKEREELEQRVAKELERKSAKQYQGQLEELKEQLQESQAFQEKAKTQLDEAKKKAAKQAREDADVQLKELKEELSTKDLKLSELRDAEIALRKDKKQVEEQKAEMALDIERKIEAERHLIVTKANEAFAFKEAELKKKISDAQKSNEELSRKLEQGSQQLQGEVLELEVESLLQQDYPFDHIEPVKKGARGADVIQTVKLRSGSICGKIIWETKRAENWSSNWVPKLKEDLQRVNGDIAVLVSTVFPSQVNDSIVQYEGVWLVRPELVSGLSAALRTVLIESQRQKTVSAGKGEQMEALFDYITSNQFAQRIRAVVENYETMQADLEKEKAAMQRLWKKRETQIGRISDQMLSVCGELQGLSSASAPMLEDIAGLEFALQDE